MIISTTSGYNYHDYHNDSSRKDALWVESLPQEFALRIFLKLLNWRQYSWNHKKWSKMVYFWSLMTLRLWECNFDFQMINFMKEKDVFISNLSRLTLKINKLNWFSNLYFPFSVFKFSIFQMSWKCLALWNFCNSRFFSKTWYFNSRRLVKLWK